MTSNTAASTYETGNSKDRDNDQKTVEVLFNTIKIQMPKGKHSGAQIKQYAIAAGIAIQTSFVLAMKHGNRFENVSDSDIVNVHPNLEFSALAGDDNS